MAVIPVRTVPDPVLLEKAKRVPVVDRSIRRLAEDMLETMHAYNGAGLAAPQVGKSCRMVVISVAEEGDLVLINPSVVKRRGERILTEGCLSLPGYVGEVRRAETVTVKATGLDGREFRLKAEDLLAEALEHEIDHLDGILYVNRLVTPDSLQPVDPAARYNPGENPLV